MNHFHSLKARTGTFLFETNVLLAPGLLNWGASALSIHLNERHAFHPTPQRGPCNFHSQLSSQDGIADLKAEPALLMLGDLFQTRGRPTPEEAVVLTLPAELLHQVSAPDTCF